MLLRLFVKNFALVKHLELNLNKNFVVLTGETGAGKSLLIGALSCLLGSKIDYSLLLKKNEECVIEGTFSLDSCNLEQLGLPKDELLIIKRKFDENGKSLTFCNGETISLNKLRLISENLIEINGQHQGSKLLNEENHSKIIDSLKEVNPLSEEVVNLFREVKEQCKLLRLAEIKDSEIKKRIESIENDIAEIEKVNPKANEDESLKSRKKTLENRSIIIENLVSIVSKIKSNENSILSWLKEVIRNTETLSQYNPSWKELTKEIETVRTILNEIGSIAEKEIESLDFTPDELEKVQGA